MIQDVTERTTCDSVWWPLSCVDICLTFPAAYMNRCRVSASPTDTPPLWRLIPGVLQQLQKA